MTQERDEEGITRRKSGGKNVVEIKSARYKLPIVLPEGIYNIVERITRNSISTVKERNEAGQKYYDALVKAQEEDAKLTPEERKKRNQDYEARKREERDKRLEEARVAIEEMRKKGLIKD